MFPSSGDPEGVYWGLCMSEHRLTYMGHWTQGLVCWGPGVSLSPDDAGGSMLGSRGVPPARLTHGQYVGAQGCPPARVNQGVCAGACVCLSVG